MHFFQVKLKLPLSKLLSTLKVLIDFANNFRSAEYALSTSGIHFNFRQSLLLITFAERNC